ncbi:MAG: ABC transporter ATP-binding protein, partial [Candidatus Sumerlaeia bacterium]|nr:ABC transporter ATP-binding protein [Candidatus Sumerlaeia bacterium]
QRLALARALLRKPALLILDEATNHLDAENERRILDAIMALRGRTTVLLITHRPDMVGCADILFRLEKGRLLQSETG